MTKTFTSKGRKFTSRGAFRQSEQGRAISWAVHALEDLALHSMEERRTYGLTRDSAYWKEHHFQEAATILRNWLTDLDV